MRTTIFNSEDLRYNAAIESITSSRDGFSLAITSQRPASHQPNEEHVRFLACLDREGLERLGALIQTSLQCQGQEEGV